MCPAGAVASFAGVGNPHLRSAIQPGETVIDPGVAGLDAIIAFERRSDRRVIGVDLNPSMRLKQAHAGRPAPGCSAIRVVWRRPLPDASADVVTPTA